MFTSKLDPHNTDMFQNQSESFARFWGEPAGKREKLRWLRILGNVNKASTRGRLESIYIRTMTRLRIYKSIAIIATALTVGEASSSAVVSAESSSSSSSKISSRFLDSLEHANNNNEVDTNNSPLEEINDENVLLDSSSQRRELTWWTFALQLGTFIICSFISFF